MSRPTRAHPPGFALHYQEAYMPLAKNPDHRLPLHVRVAFLANARHRKNGHARFGPGELRELLEIADPKTGVLRNPNPASVSKAINVAVELGLLAKGSSARCLIVPPQLVRGGVVGDPDEPCGAGHNFAPQAKKQAGTLPHRQRGFAPQAKFPRKAAGQRLDPLDSVSSPCRVCGLPHHDRPCTQPPDNALEATA